VEKQNPQRQCFLHFFDRVSNIVNTLFVFWIATSNSWTSISKEIKPHKHKIFSS